MVTKKVVRALVLGLGLTLLGQTAMAQEPSTTASPAPILTLLWSPPNDITTRDLFNGPGGVEQAPNLQRVTFIKEEEPGYSTKYRVRDASGREWVAKIGNEAQSETAAVRLVWAVGYQTEINYLVPSVNIIGKGSFKNVRFEARPDNIKRKNEWSWTDNPFVGTHELQGLKIMMALLNNWDLKDSNNKILSVRDGKDETQRSYVISDLGATFGKSGSLPLFWRVTRSRNKPDDFEDAKFIDGVKANRVDFHYNGRNRGLFDNISMDDAAWLAGWLTQLSDRQIADAFRAANYDDEDIRTLTDAVKGRIGELAAISRGAQGVTVSN